MKSFFEKCLDAKKWADDHGCDNVAIEHNGGHFLAEKENGKWGEFRIHTYPEDYEVI